MRLTRPTQRTLPPMSPMRRWRLRGLRTKRYPPGRRSALHRASRVRVEQPTDWLSPPYGFISNYLGDEPSLAGDFPGQAVFFSNPAHRRQHRQAAGTAAGFAAVKRGVTRLRRHTHDVRAMSACVPGRVETLRGISAPGILRLVVTLRAKKCKNSSSAPRYDQIRFRFHTA
jgi:hypothetical protein